MIPGLLYWHALQFCLFKYFFLFPKPFWHSSYISYFLDVLGIQFIVQLYIFQNIILIIGRQLEVYWPLFFFDDLPPWLILLLSLTLCLLLLQSQAICPNPPHLKQIWYSPLFLSPFTAIGPGPTLVPLY